ncbi:MAG: ribonucleotide reductase subunit alpha [Alteromonadaceae bacterium]|nr:MAG: ribonucleotide reductase subunit alpha [Alteromonadaceae bacterium]
MLTSFSDLISYAKQQPTPQRLLFLFANTQDAKKTGKHSKSGTIAPVMCVDKLPDEIQSFEDFVKEADQISTQWDFIIIAALSGEGNTPPTSDDAEIHLNKMTNDLTQGQSLASYVIFDRNENPITMQ